MTQKDGMLLASDRQQGCESGPLNRLTGFDTFVFFLWWLLLAHNSLFLSCQILNKEMGVTLAAKCCVNIR